jgi:hypothetical protein
MINLSKLVRRGSRLFAFCGCGYKEDFDAGKVKNAGVGVDPLGWGRGRAYLDTARRACGLVGASDSIFV